MNRLQRVILWLKGEDYLTDRRLQLSEEYARRCARKEPREHIRRELEALTNQQLRRGA